MGVENCQKNWVGVCSLLPETLTPFQTKPVIFSTDLPCNQIPSAQSIPYFRAKWLKLILYFKLKQLKKPYLLGLKVFSKIQLVVYH